ncbi:hypothetical protein EV356DRAFT_504616 [Viridothelium virens]|uniref:Uncharacterized protein n=1 Tax=Viridothelium virens TaxID=1048519 RepID=A0A6A6H5A9_VIRVR|nr:hypothetical protein EV356DRAFT_504616 [Viridothelium virens]
MFESVRWRIGCVSYFAAYGCFPSSVTLPPRKIFMAVGYFIKVRDNRVLMKEKRLDNASSIAGQRRYDSNMLREASYPLPNSSCPI